MRQPRLVDLPFTEVAQLIYDQRNMVEDEVKVQRILDEQEQADQDRFIVSLNRVPVSCQRETIETGDPVVSELLPQHTRASLKNQVEIGEPEVRVCHS